MEVPIIDLDGNAYYVDVFSGPGMKHERLFQPTNGSLENITVVNGKVDALNADTGIGKHRQKLKLTQQETPAKEEAPHTG